MLLVSIIRWTKPSILDTASEETITWPSLTKSEQRWNTFHNIVKMCQCYKHFS